MIKYYLVCFDISDDKHRYKVGKTLLEYGDRIQGSVFKIAVNRHTQLQQLQKQLMGYIAPGDHLRFYYLTKDGRKLSINHKGEPLAEFPSVIII